MLKRSLLALVMTACAGLASAPRVGAEVTRVEVTTRADVGASGYEKIVGTVRFAVANEAESLTDCMVGG